MRTAAILLSVGFGLGCVARHTHEDVALPIVAPVPVIRDAKYDWPSDTNNMPTVLFAIDGVRWQEIFEGEDKSRIARNKTPRTPREITPVLHSLSTFSGAFVGRTEPMRASGPEYLSLPGYSEMFSGMKPVHCANNDCTGVGTTTFVDRLHQAGKKVAVFASWPRIEVAASGKPGAFPMSVGRHVQHRMEDAKGDAEFANLLSRGEDSSPYPGEGDYRPDVQTAAIALRYFESERPDFMFVGFGDTDEQAHARNYARYVDALTFADKAIGRFIDAAHERGVGMNVLVTTDHGRAADFASHGGAWQESSRVFLLAAGPTITGRGSVALETPATLSSIAPTIELLFGISDRTPSPIPGAAGAVFAARDPNEGRVLSELFLRREPPVDDLLAETPQLPSR